MSQGRRFTIVHVFIIIGLFTVDVLIAAPALINLPRRGCYAQQNDKANLRGIYQGVLGYAGENDEAFPAFTRSHSHAQGFHPLLRQTELDTSTESFKQATDSNISAAMWLLVREDHLPVKIFVSPHTDEEADPVTNDQDERVTVTEIYDFKSPDHLSYSFINFYHENVRSRWSSNIGPTEIIAGNSNDGFTHGQGPTNLDNLESNKSMNSKTHDGKGQNMVFGDGHAEFISTPIDEFHQDNVYTWWDQNGNKNDILSIKALIEGQATVITSNLAEHTVKAENVKQDTFLLPIQSLANMAGQSTTMQPD